MAGLAQAREEVGERPYDAAQASRFFCRELAAAALDDRGQHTIAGGS
jgi:hypothetical protein